MLPVNSATNPAGSACPRSDRAASCNPAAHPSVRAARAATAASGRLHAGPGRRLLQERRRLVCGEPQLRGPQLSQLPASPQPGQPQRRVTAGGQHQVQPGRAVLKQEPKRRVHLLCVDQVVVVEDQYRLVVVTGLGGKLVDQSGHHALERRRRRRTQQGAQPPGDPWAHPVQRGNGMAPEPTRVVVARVQRQPRGRPTTAPGPVGQQDRLAVPGRGGYHDQPSP